LKTIQSAEGIGIDAAGNLYVSSMGGGGNAVVRFDKTADGWGAETPFVRGLQAPGDVEVSPDGSIYVADRRGAPPNVKRYDASGKLLKKINVQMQATAGAGVTLGIGVDLDCNLWVGNAQQRNVAQYSPSGKLLATATSGDMIANDIVFGPSGDFYVFDVYAPNNVVRFAADKAKPAGAIATASLAKKGAQAVARVKYTLSGVSCPAQVDATASLSGGASGSAKTKVGAGKTTVIEIPLAKAPAKGTTATFKIVLKTNGRPTTQTASVKLG
jgi:sugar lactone lactonase YvrE